MPKEVFQDLRKTRVCGQRLAISRPGKHGKKGKGGHKRKKQKKTDS
jgi:hypothetical protein